MISAGIISGTAHEDPQDNILISWNVLKNFSRILQNSSSLQHSFFSNLLRDYSENFFKDYFNISSRNLFHYFFSHIYLIVTLGDVLKNPTLVFLENT